MTANANAAHNSDLQFDRVATTGPSLGCAKCGRAVTTYYYTVDDSPVCAMCKRSIEVDRSSNKSGLARAAGYGFGAAVAGAAIYYAVIAITNFEIGIVALLIGYMVGRAVLAGAGRGGRRFQVLAAGLTYLAVGMAYMPLAIKPLMEGRATSTLVKRTSTTMRDTTAMTPDSAAAVKATHAPARKPKGGVGMFAWGLVAVIAFVVLLPILAILGSMPTGVISALIIGIGMRRAWRMLADTGATGAGSIAGPFRVGQPGIVASA